MQYNLKQGEKQTWVGEIIITCITDKLNLSHLLGDDYNIMCHSAEQAN